MSQTYRPFHKQTLTARQYFILLNSLKSLIEFFQHLPEEEYGLELSFKVGNNTGWLLSPRHGEGWHPYYSVEKLAVGVQRGSLVACLPWKILRSLKDRDNLFKVNSVSKQHFLSAFYLTVKCEKK